MKVFLNRFLAYLCLGLFLGLAVGPFSGMVEQPGVNVSKHIPSYHASPGGSFLGSGYRTMNTHVASKKRLAWFNTVRYALSFAFLLLGLGFAKKMIQSGLDIPLDAPWVVYLRDGIFTLFLAIGDFFVLDQLMTHMFHTIPVFQVDRIVFDMVTIGIVPVTAFCAWFASRQQQYLRIAAEGITLMTSGDSNFIPWGDIQGFEVKDSHILMGEEDWAAPRALQRHLVIQTSREPINVVEPTFKGTKKKILGNLKSMAPPHLYADIARVAGQW